MSKEKSNMAQIYFLGSIEEPTTVLRDPAKGGVRYRFTNRTNPHLVPLLFADYLVEMKPKLYGFSEKDIYKARGIKKVVKKTSKPKSTKPKSDKKEGGK